MRFRLRTLSIVLRAGPPVVAVAWWQYANWRARSHVSTVSTLIQPISVPTWHGPTRAIRQDASLRSPLTSAATGNLFTWHTLCTYTNVFRRRPPTSYRVCRGDGCRNRIYVNDGLESAADLAAPKLYVRRFPGTPM